MTEITPVKKLELDSDHVFFNFVNCLTLPSPHQMKSKADANSRNTALLKQNNDLMEQMRQMKSDIEALKGSSLAKVTMNKVK